MTSKMKEKEITIIRNGTLIDGTGANPVKDSVVIVEGNIVTAAGRESQVEIPKKAKKKVIDASGQTVMPGLIDAHLHLSGMKTDRVLEEMILRPEKLSLIKSVYDAIDLLEAGFTTVKDCGGFGIS
ncbi:MAG: amidohydrolase family protein, partial [Candidatus Bathyarchaeia archaeon]